MPDPNALSVITQAFVALGVYDPGNTITADDSQTGLIWFQNMIDAWAADRLTLTVVSEIFYTLPSGSTSVLIGPTGDINTARPTYIQGINYVIPGSAPQVETPMGRMDDDSYMNLSIKLLPNNLPTQWYYRPTPTNGTLIFWPRVQQDVIIKIYAPQPNNTITALTDTFVGPNGWQEAGIAQLAMRLSIPYARNPPPLLPDFAAQAYARIKRPQLVSPGLLGVDAALVPTAGGGYNIRNDQSVGPSNRG